MPNFTHQKEDARTGAPAMEFPSAPEEWTPAKARDQAAEENLTLTTDHWVVISALQAYYAKTEEIDRNMREMHDMLEERFHAKGGIKYLYELFPGGPIAQGCRLAGLKAPAIAVDKGFGSVA